VALVDDDRPAQVALLEALRASQQRLVSTLAAMPADAVDRLAYTAEWTVAQVASHLGSGAETFLLFLVAGLEGTAAPGPEQFQPIWDRWDAKTPQGQVRDVVATDTAFLDAVAALGEPQQQAWRLQMFGTERDLTGLLRMRLAEHVLHTWDIAVALDPTAVLPPEAAGLVVEHLPMMVGFVAKPTAPMTVRVETTNPARTMTLELDPTGSRLDLDPPVGDEVPVLRLPAESFVRLVYGRLDPAHTPTPVHADPDLLNTLRSTFPGV
jgi:uncharacterized protein (TIGR03083 family)